MARYAQDTAPPASDISNTPAGNIAATNMQAAVNELDGEKLAKTAEVTAFVVLDETAYAALSPPVATTLYLVIADA